MHAEYANGRARQDSEGASNDELRGRHRAKAPRRHGPGAEQGRAIPARPVECINAAGHASHRCCLTIERLTISPRPRSFRLARGITVGGRLARLLVHCNA